MKTYNSWLDFYTVRNNKSYYNHIRDKYSPFIDKISECILANNYQTIVELGCGIGSITRSLIERFPTKIYDVVDKDKEMLNLCISNLSYLSTIQFWKADILKTSFGGDIIHSHGVLEHFSDSQIRKIISLQKGKTLLHYVPSNKYDNPSFGDERLMSPEQWEKICSPDETIEFNDGYDLILKWNND